MTSFNLPENYNLKKEIDFQKNMKLMVLINIGVLLLCIPLVIIGLFICPIEIDLVKMIKNGEESKFFILAYLFFSVTLGIIVYMVLHELVHGFFIKRYCGERAEYGV
ncbi:MAG: hypothetical protein WAX04_07680, partial [Oscillospiraceae bacterium]